jgi:hypothetical protein
MAVSAAPGSWMAETEPEDIAPGAQSVDTPAVRKIAEQVARLARSRMEGALGEARAGLSQTAPGQFEPALVILGRWLGAESFKPPGQARSDAAWCYGDAMWITLEAKSDQNPDGPVAVRDIREANTQLRLLGSDRGVEPPENSFSVIISPRSTVDPNAARAADPHLHLVESGTLIALVDDLQRAGQSYSTRRRGTRLVTPSRCWCAVYSRHTRFCHRRSVSVSRQRALRPRGFVLTTASTGVELWKMVLATAAENDHPRERRSGERASSAHYVSSPIPAAIIARASPIHALTGER